MSRLIITPPAKALKVGLIAIPVCEDVANHILTAFPRKIEEESLLSEKDYSGSFAVIKNDAGKLYE